MIKQEILKYCILSKETTSKASRDGRNAKRKLSFMEEMQNVKMGRRMDDGYEGSGVELGAIKIGHHDDTTKEFRDARLKLPMVMKDMLSTLVFIPFVGLAYKFR